jgi:hypothetical protein
MRKIQSRDLLKEVKNAIAYQQSPYLKVDTLFELLEMDQDKNEVPGLTQSELHEFEEKHCKNDEEKLELRKSMRRIALDLYIRTYNLKLPVIPRRENETDHEYSERYNQRITDFMAKLNKK